MADALYRVEPDTGAVTTLTMLDRPEGLSMKPHGIALQPRSGADGAQRLHVITKDTVPACKGQGDAIEHYTLDGDTLTFTGLTGDIKFTELNDLVVAADGRGFVMNTPSFESPWKRLRHWISRCPSGRLLYTPDINDPDVLWRTSEKRLPTPNSIALHPLNDQLLIVSTHRRVLVLKQEARRGRLKLSRVQRFNARGAADNITVSGTQVLIASMSPSRTAAAAGKNGASVKIPPRVVAFTATADGLEHVETWKAPKPSPAQAVSVAWCVDGDLWLGQIFNAGLYRYPDASICTPTP